MTVREQCLSARDLGLQAEDEEVLDVLDLPQLYSKPSTKALLVTLDDITSHPPSWEVTPRNGTPLQRSGTATSARKRRRVRGEGIPAYLTSIIANPLAWIDDYDEKEQVWEAASQRLAERSGRTAMGDMTRSFTIPVGHTPEDRADVADPDDFVANTLELTIHEPALTSDNLGLKTWASSYLLAKRLSALLSTLPPLPADALILELGAGTGLVGMAAAAVFQRTVLLTDLPDIVPNLERNVSANAEAMFVYGGEASSGVLDWSDPGALISGPAQGAMPTSDPESLPLVLAADPIYSPDHPRLLVQAIEFYLERVATARVVVEMPVREAYGSERQDFRERMVGMGLCVFQEGEEVGYDDWADGKDEEELAEVRCWWSVWGWK
ncbi:hypothetical protein LTR62_003088 [Meristemomyces frigidus]|uniref:Glucose-inducible SAM-dependent methyltransferase Rrg1 n=1 Tax=Meristemomyces frigidus TaxID=1508187 RepID=A0AAN7YH81_9PEZI|nr:hypothetical protein LTR62_003088 [Meristemomyces frigidus]